MKPFKFNDFFFLKWTHFKKHVKLSRKEDKKSLAGKYFVTFNKKKVFREFDDSGEFAPNKVAIQKNAFLFNVWKQP